MKLIKTLIASVAAMVIAGGFALSAQAALINGTIGFTSADNHPVAGGGGSVTQLGTNTTINFNNPLSVDFGIGDFAGTNGADVTFTDFTFSGSGNTAALVGGSVIPLWTFTSGANAYSFDLSHLMSATFTAGGNNALDLSGEGIVHITGFQNTLAMFSLHANGHVFTFDILQAGSSANGEAVPDAGSAVSLLGLGLLGLEVLRRKLIA